MSSTHTDHARLYYVHDPMCSWCWGFRPTWLQVQQDLAPGIDLVTLVGGLAPDSDQPMDPGLRRQLEQTWQRITQQIPGTRFNFDFWRVNVPRRSTYPACRAVIAARQMADLEAEMTLAIQQAYYLEARNPSEVETLTDCAVSIGLDRTAFAERLGSAQLNRDFVEELDRVRSVGVDSFPSLVLDRAGARWNIPLNYTKAQPMLDDIDQLLATA